MVGLSLNVFADEKLLQNNVHLALKRFLLERRSRALGKGNIYIGNTRCVVF